MTTSNADISKTFRELIQTAEKKFARVRDIPTYAPHSQSNIYRKVFKSYMRLWKFQQENRAKLVEYGLQRWEIGDIASRIGQLYFGQYIRTSEAKFLLESYVFYEAIYNRSYFGGGSGGGGKDISVRFKELRFYVRFLLVAVLLNRNEMVKVIVERFKELVEDSKSTFRESNFKEWKQVVHEITQFMKVNASFRNARPLRYCAIFDSHPGSLPYVARFHAKKVLKLQDAVLVSYHRNEVKFAEFTLDTYRMLQCLEWEPSGSFYQKGPIEPRENGRVNDYSGTSGMIDINLAVDLTDPTLPPNPRKAILYRPTATNFIAVIATMCEELPPERVMLIYLSCSGSAASISHSQVQSLGGSKRSSKTKVVPHTSHDVNSGSEIDDSRKGYLTSCYGKHLLLGPRRNSASNNVYPGDLVPFTRKPLFLVIDSDVSDAFKVLHGSEIGEPVALLLSPLRPALKPQSSVDAKQSGSQFTFFLTAPMQAFCELVGVTFADEGMDVYEEAENILSSTFSEWEVILCTSTSLDLVWAQVLSDPFLRRLIIRFIFCRAVLSFFHPPEERCYHSPVCLPELPSSLSPVSEAVKYNVIRLAEHLEVSDVLRYT